jgi:ribose/xylose/arabinose/galactoside ABC-type transport system permease subunit
MAAKNMVKGTMSNESFITLSMLGVLAGLFIVASLFVPRFFDIQTISNQLSQQAELIILSLASHLF